MKSKEEIIEDVTGVPEDDQYLCSYGNDIVIRCMHIYAAQEVERAIAEHEAKQWHKYPEDKPESDGRYLIITPEGYRYITVWSSSVEWSKYAVEYWREHPSPYQEGVSHD